MIQSLTAGKEEAESKHQRLKAQTVLWKRQIEEKFSV